MFVLFGVRTPLIHEYEETCARLNLAIHAGIQVDDRAPRMRDRDKIVKLADVTGRLENGATFIACAFGPNKRQGLVELAESIGLSAADPIIDPTSVIASSARIGKGVYVNAGSVIASSAFIGDHVFINRTTSIGHHVLISDFVTIGPGVTIPSNVRIGSSTFVGAGSVILPNVTIGDGAIVSAGTVVRKHVPERTLVFGNPVKYRTVSKLDKYTEYAGQE